ncbi:hypothetical protein LE197_12935 [Pseudomonas sp. PS1(2021)]|uniref:hypothetical protein n=1 Tax=Pseudomonas sp. PS1(2021) TaxID=2866282 RepID=UPI001CF01C4C|nr:hypothetical protein [Pseudomonas sp. PS1(2021)]UCM30739.1 hypothetical protein LE197_12935 [Pseudomonas sp. PS1(2021)]
MNKANECTCPSGDGSLVHPCPAHPAVEQVGVDERATFELFVRKHCGMPAHIAVNWDAKFTNDAWAGWQARAALAQPSPAHPAPVEQVGTNVGHGHVFPRADGVKMRCGGPGLCSECAADASRARAALAQPSPMRCLACGGYHGNSGLPCPNMRVTAQAQPSPTLPPFAEKVLAKLRRFNECAEDSDSGGVDIGRHWLDLLTQLGLLNRVQRSPALWEISQQGEDLLGLDVPEIEVPDSMIEKAWQRFERTLQQLETPGQAEQAEQAEAERPEGPTEDELEAAGLGYPLHKEEAVKLWYSGFRSEVITVLEAWEAIGHDTGINPDKEELLDSLRYMLEKCEAHDAALAEVAGLRSLLNSLLCYVERDIDRMRSDRDKSDNKEIYDRSISLAMERLKAAQNAVFTTEPGCDTAVELAAQTTQAQHCVPELLVRAEDFVSGKEVPQAWLDVQAERRRQITAEGWTPEHDDLYCAAELPRAAAAYILNGANDEAPAIWPFSAKWWKPRDARSNYVRAGALILAEIERLDRAAAAGKEVGHE